jgi:hypothetical protein
MKHGDIHSYHHYHKGNRFMRKLAMFIVTIIIFSGLSVVTVSCKETDYKKATISFSNLQIKEDREGITVELNGANSILLKKDYYIVPTRIVTFTFPFGTEINNVQCVLKNIREQHLTKKLTIAPEPVAAGQPSSNILNKNSRNPISINTWYDYSIGCGVYGNQRNIIVKVEVFPVQYYPSENLVYWAETVDIEIQYTKPEQTSISFDEEYDLLILTPNKYIAQLEPLVAHKNNRGILTKIVTLDQIENGTYFPIQGRDSVEEIKYFIKNAIENWLITNVLIVGGSSDFPARETHVLVGDNDNETFVSDLYYADIYDGQGNFSSWDSNNNSIFAEYNWDGKTDKIDFYPDVKIGRLACINIDQVTTAVNKIIKYENDKAYTQNWFYNIVVIGGDTVPDDDSEIDEGERVNQFILDRMQGFIPDKIWDSNERLSGRIPTGLTNIKNGIENGCGFLDFSGHGAPWIWTTFPHNGERQSLPTPTGRYTNTIIGELTNGDRLPIVVNGGCSLGKYQEDENCNAWAFIANPNGGGIASFGAAGLGYIYVGEYVTEGLVEGLTIDIFEAYRDGAITFGEMYADGLTIYIHKGLGDGDYKTLMEWHAFGDPTLTIGEVSIPPNTPDVPIGPRSGKAHTSYTYSASSIDSEGDQISYLFDWGDGTFSEWTSLINSGQTASVNHTWKSSGSYQIRVKAKDNHGVKSDWSDPLPITMPYSYNPILQFLEFLFLRFPNTFPILRHLFG